MRTLLRRLGLTTVLGLLACAAPRAEGKRDAVPSPSSNAGVVPLGSGRHALVSAGVAGLERALTEWSLLKPGSACVLVFDATAQWLVNCPAAPTAEVFVPTGETLGGHPVRFNPKPVSLGGQQVPYDALKAALVGTVASVRLEGSADASPVFVVHDWRGLHANHPGFTQSPADEWLGVFVHEGFHASQLWHPRARALTERWASAAPPVGPDELAKFYATDEGYRAAVTAEFELLRAAVDGTPGPEQARTALATWLRRYEARRVAFEPALEAAYPRRQAWTLDGFLTFVEGTARYVEAKYLIDPPREEGLAAEPTFQHFKASRGLPPSKLVGIGGMGKRYFYALGMYLSFLLDVAQPDWKAHVFDDERFLVGQVERAVAKRP